MPGKYSVFKLTIEHTPTGDFLNTYLVSLRREDLLTIELSKSDLVEMVAKLLEQATHSTEADSKTFSLDFKE